MGNDERDEFVRGMWTGVAITSMFLGLPLIAIYLFILT